MNEKKDSVDKLLHLINSDILIVGFPSYTCMHIFAQFSKPELEGISVKDEYEFLKLFFPVDSDMKITTKL